MISRKLLYVLGTFLALFLTQNQLHAQTITVTSPSIFIPVIVGSTMPVVWQASDLTGNVTIELYKNSGFYSTLIADIANDGSEDLPVPAAQLPDEYATYRVVVRSVDDPSIFGQSNIFAIDFPFTNTFEIISPSAGETFDSGENVNVTWNGSNSGLIRIELLQDGNYIQTLDSSTPDDGSHIVTFPVLRFTASNYSIRIISIQDSSITSQSGTFTIFQRDFLVIYEPALNNQYSIGNPLPIIWDSNVGGNVKIDLYQGANLITTLADVTPNDYNETLTIPTSLAGGTNFKIKISSLPLSSVSNESAEFTILSSVASGAGSDLVIQDIGSADVIGNIYSVSGIEIVNVGNNITTSVSYSVGAYLSTDETITHSDFRVSTVGIFSDTAPGGIETGNVNFDITSLGLPLGEYYFGVIVDEFDDETEIEESNNTGSITSPKITITSQNEDCILISKVGEASESFEQGLGDWTQSSEDNMDWTRTSTSTPSSGTGPTTASQGQFYMFTESSGGNRNKRAILNSNCYDLTASTSTKLLFDYHMYGATMGSLTVFVIDERGNSIKVFMKQGDQGQVWRSAIVDLAPFTGQKINIQIEALTGISYRSDIGLDNIRISELSCDLSGTTCDDGDSCTVGESYDEKCNCVGGTYTDQDQDGFCIGEDIDDTDACLPSAGLECNSCESTVTGSFSDGFEGDLNKWNQSTTDANQWLIDADGTPSSKTGPSIAAVGSNYLFIESSGSGSPFKSAVISSQDCLDLSSIDNPTLSFHYHMYGSTMGTLIFSIIDVEDGSIAEVFNISGDQGDEWHTGQIDLGSYSDKSIKLMIEGVTGIGFRSDIAIDNVNIQSNIAGVLTQTAESRNYVETASANLDDLEEAELTIFPMPATDYFIIEYTSTEEAENADVSLINTNGQVVMHQIISINHGSIEKKVDVSNLPSGSYFVNIKTDVSQTTKQVLIFK